MVAAHSDRRPSNRGRRRADQDPKTSKRRGKLTTAEACDSDDDSESDFLCAICTEPLNDPSIGGGCTHHYCNGCLTRWARAASHPFCPICRAPILRVLRDPEFASSIGATSGGIKPSDEAKRKLNPNSRSLTVSWPPGLSLASTARHEATGEPARLIVSSVIPGNGAAFAGICQGEEVLSVNGVPVTDHQTAIQLMERHCANDSLILEVLPANEDTTHAIMNTVFHVRTSGSDQYGMHASAVLDAMPRDASSDEMDDERISLVDFLRLGAQTPPGEESSMLTDYTIYSTRDESRRPAPFREPRLLPRQPAGYDAREPPFSRVPSLHNERRGSTRSESPSASAAENEQTVYRDGEPAQRGRRLSQRRNGIAGDTQLQEQLAHALESGTLQAPAALVSGVIAAPLQSIDPNDGGYAL